MTRDEWVNRVLCMILDDLQALDLPAMDRYEHLWDLSVDVRTVARKLWDEELAEPS